MAYPSEYPHKLTIICDLKMLDIFIVGRFYCSLLSLLLAFIHIPGEAQFISNKPAVFGASPGFVLDDIIKTVSLTAISFEQEDGSDSPIKTDLYYIIKR